MGVAEPTLGMGKATTLLVQASASWPGTWKT